MVIAGIFFVALPGVRASEGDPRIHVLEKKVMGILVDMDSLKQAGAGLLGQSGIVTQRIHMYRSRESLSRRQHRNLEKQLQQAQALEQQVQSIQNKLDSLSGEFVRAGRILLSLYQAELDRFADTGTAEPRTVRERDFQSLLVRKEALEKQLYPVGIREISALQVEAQPWDTAPDLMRKADLLRDQEESFRKELVMVDERLHSLRQEASARRRAEELTREMDLFNPQEELFARGLDQYNAARNDLGYWEESGQKNPPPVFGPGDDNAISVPVTDGESIEMHSAEHATAPRTLGSVISSIKNLEQHRARLLSVADSLGRRSAWFREQAGR